MTTAQTIVNDAYRENNIVAFGQTPDTNQSTEGLTLLNRILYSFYGDVLGEYLMDWPVPSTTRTAPVNARFPLSPADEALPDDVWPYPPNNVRLVAKLSTATTVYLPFEPNDGAFVGLADAGSTASINLIIDANGRKIEGNPTLTVVPNTTTTARWMYRADLADWVRLNVLTLTDSSPLPFEFDDTLTALLAVRLAPRYGREVRETTAAVASDGYERLRKRYKQETAVYGQFDPLMLSRQAHSRNYYTDDRRLYGR